MRTLKVLSLFDGIACARVALEREGFNVLGYFASEIEKEAITIAQRNWPDIKQVGDVTKLRVENGGVVWEGGGFNFSTKIDLLIGGSPCQDLSIAKGGRLGLKGSRSGLFWEFVRILEEAKPKYFVLENVASMPKEARAIITEALGVEPIMIDAGLVSAQRRKRLFWTNIPNVELPKDRGIKLVDILEDIPAVPDGLEIKEKSKTIRVGGGGSAVGDKHEWDSVFQYRRTYWRKSGVEKSPTLTANMGTGGNNVPYIGNDKAKRVFTITELERLQSLPDGYTGGVSATHRKKAIGNAFNVEVVRHILSHIPHEA